MSETPGYSMIDRLEQDINRILIRNEELKASNRRLAEESRRLERQTQEQQARIAELESRLEQLLLKRSLTEVTGGVKAAKLRINRLLKEIDQCIALMNK